MTGAAAAMLLRFEHMPFLAALAHQSNAKLVVEVGTFTGLSSLILAASVQPSARVITHDLFERWARVGRPFWLEAGVDKRIEARFGPASETLKLLPNEEIDLVFIDADKSGAYDDFPIKVTQPLSLPPAPKTNPARRVPSLLEFQNALRAMLSHDHSRDR